MSIRIDCHTHAFSEKIAKKAVAKLIDYYGIPTTFKGTVPELLAESKRAGLDAAVVLVAATRADQVKPAHDWILSSVSPLDRADRSPRLVPFGTFHPDDADWQQEIGRLRDAGIRGIKLHPEFQQIDLADPRLLPFFEEVERDFVLMVHVGDPRVGENNPSTPPKVAHIAESFPALRIIAAHMGGYCMWEAAFEVLAGTRVYLDTSSTLGYIDPGMFRKLVEKHGVDRVLFGSDFPLRSPAEDHRAFDFMTWLSSRDKELILGENCRGLLNL